MSAQPDWSDPDQPDSPDADSGSTGDDTGSGPYVVEPSTNGFDDDLSDGGLFEGDRGVLPLTARKALVLLLKRTHLTAITHPAEWRALLDNIEQVEITLHHLFLELVVDEHNEVAYKRQAGREIQTRSFTTLVKDRKYTAEEAAMLLVLRQIQQNSRGLGEPAAFVDRADLHERLVFLRRDSSDEVRDQEAVDRAIETLTKEDLLLRVRGDDDRLRISPVIETILNVQRVQQFYDAAYSGIPDVPAGTPGPAAAAGAGADGFDFSADEGTTP